MGIRVELTPDALADMEAIHRWVTEAAPHQGQLWFDRLQEAIQSLTDFPNRCPVNRRLSKRSFTVRVLRFGRDRNVYRVYYTVGADAVSVFNIRRAVRREPRRL